MKYPMINKRQIREINIPQMSGGMNLRDSLTGVNDNQMTDCVNVWYKNGKLRTRPPFVTDYSMLNMTGRNSSNEKVSTRFHEEIKVVYEGVTCVCVTNKRITVDESGNENCTIEFEFLAKDKIFVMPTITSVVGKDISYFCAENGGILYCYISDYSIWKLDYAKTTELNETKPAWEKVELNDRYIPKVYIHCMRSGFDDFKGTLFEGYNLIGNRYKMIYSAYNVNDSNTTHPMRYALGQDLAKSGEIKVEVTSYDTVNEKPIVVEHSIKYSENDYQNFKNGKILIEKTVNDETPKDSLFLFVKKNYVGFLSDSNSESSIVTIDTDEKIKKYGNIEDNIVITVPYETSESDLKKVFCMSRTIWFGGVNYGINGGSRLFLCGNSCDEYKSLLIWSDLDNPLYFGENFTAYVGNVSEKITTFGRQGENLILFKENKIYSTYYAENSEITVDDVINQSVVDYSANKVFFPIVEINGYIGCDCPDTVQMCRNRLVWANSVGRIYTLCTVSQYNECSVYEISEMITSKLKSYKEELKTATSADFCGHYILFLGDCAFVADYCCYGYKYIYSYSKKEDSNAMIPWYYWKFDFIDKTSTSDVYKNVSICILEDSLMMRSYFDASSDNKAAFVNFSMDEEIFSECETVFYNDLVSKRLKLKNDLIKNKVATKIFELGNGHYCVNVERVVIKSGANNGSDINVKCISDCCEENIVLTTNEEFLSQNEVDYVTPRKLYPRMRSVLKFGIQIESEGMLCIDGLALFYRLLGGSK